MVVDKLILFIFSTLVGPNKINNHAKFQRFSSNRLVATTFFSKNHIHTYRRTENYAP